MTPGPDRHERDKESEHNADVDANKVSINEIRHYIMGYLYKLPGTAIARQNQNRRKYKIKQTATLTPKKLLSINPSSHTQGLRTISKQ